MDRDRSSPPHGDPTEISLRARELFRALAEELEQGPVDVEAFVARHPDVAHELRELHAGWKRARSLIAGLVSDARVVDSALDALEAEHAPREEARLLRLEELRPANARYAPIERIGRGGMGVVHRVRDRALERELAMKTMRADRAGHGRFLRRFLDEAEILGRLEHPGVLPVYELGVDEHGRAFFTMPLVRGRDLCEVFELAWEGREGWTTARVVEVLLRVCDTLAYAHAQGVVHRDLKPANVMVGRFGETYVMDWGLARRERGSARVDHDRSGGGAAEGEDSAPRKGGAGARSTEAVEDARSPDSATEESIAPENTLEGEVLGTPAYMAPEQARGERDAIGPRADVYAIGAVLYHYLARRAPYARPGESPKSREVLARVRSEPPERLAALVPHAPAELVAICERAMERDAARRYPDVAGLADDLRAYVEGRVVRAHEQGAWAELSKWIRRNRRLALASGVALLALVGGLAAVIVVRARAAERTQFEADLRGPTALAARAEDLWPATEELVPAMEQWLAEARELVRRRALYARELEDLRSSGTPLPEHAPAAMSARTRTRQRIRELEYDALGVADDRAQIAGFAGQLGFIEANAEWDARLARNERAVEELRRELALPAGWSYADADDARRDAALARLLAELDGLESPALHGATIAALEARLEHARELERRTLVDAASAWRRALASIADPVESPLYDGLVFLPQRGLVPLERDPRSGLWEFWQPDTGERPERGAEGDWTLRPETGLVFVLVPGGAATLGLAVVPPPGSPYDTRMEEERPVHELCLDPFFCSKYEVTQAQWTRWTNTNPSYYRPGHGVGRTVASSLHPVERTTWHECVLWLARFGLELPTEAQWQHAAGSGRHPTWPHGDEPECLIGRVNLHDALSPEDWRDGYTGTSPVGCFAANDWGFFDVAGNVSEWTRDAFWSWYRWPVRDGDGMQLAPASGHITLRGGSCQRTPIELRTTAREERKPDNRSEAYGVRPVRRIAGY